MDGKVIRHYQLGEVINVYLFEALFVESLEDVFNFSDCVAQFVVFFEVIEYKIWIMMIDYILFYRCREH